MRARLIKNAFVILLAIALGTVAAPPEAPPKNLLYNGSFEYTSTFANLYDGVDAAGNLRVQRGNSVVLNRDTGSSYMPVPFPPSISFADVNGDGLPDLIVASSLGFLYWYPNVGKKGQPEFKNAKLIQTNLGTAARIQAVDWNNDGKTDILFGNIEGQINLLLNVGTSSEPQWVTTMGKPRWFPPAPSPHPQAGAQATQINESGQPISIGNYSAPFFYDWNGDGIPDLIVGEGSYSANSVRVWLNNGTKSNPSFKTELKFDLAYGEGREILCPCVYDWNGDGIPDLIVSDRDGQTTLYLGTKESTASQNKVLPIQPTKTISIGGEDRLTQVMCVCVCDFNDDGIPDILYGTANGTIMVALGSGDRKNPVIQAGKPLRGVDVAKDFRQPSNWDAAPYVSGVEYGMPYDTCAPLPQIISTEDDPTFVPKDGKYGFRLSWFDKFFGWHMLQNTNLPGVNNGYTEGVYVMNTSILQFKMGKEYELSFWRKGDAERISYSIYYSEEVPNAKNPKAGPPTTVEHRFQDLVAVNGTWNQYRKTYRLAGTKEKHFDSNGQSITGTFEMSFYGKGTAIIDDVRLVEVVR